MVTQVAPSIIEPPLKETALQTRSLKVPFRSRTQI